MEEQVHLQGCQGWEEEEQAYPGLSEQPGLHHFKTKQVTHEF